MTIKHVPPMNLFCFTTETTLMNLGKYVRVKAHKIYLEAAKRNLEVTGPVYWIYYGVDGNPDTKFKLDIGVPIHSNIQPDDQYSCKPLDRMEFATCLHEGSWNLFPHAYKQLIGEILKSGRAMNGITREVYINIDFENPDNNITEIQIGLMN